MVYREKVKIHRNSVGTKQKRALANNSRSRLTWVSPVGGCLPLPYTNDGDHKGALKCIRPVVVSEPRYNRNQPKTKMDSSSSSSERSDQEDALSRCRWFRINWKWCKMGSSSLGINIRLNPVVSFVSAVIIWGFVSYCMIKPEMANEIMKEWKSWITRTFTWMYIGTQDAWAVFIIVLYFSKYGKMKLGKPDEKPEFKDASYFTMLFAAGIGIGLFYYGVGRLIPLQHRLFRSNLIE